MYKFTVKKQKTTRNEYVLSSDGKWVRNFNINVKPIDINEDNSIDFKLFVENEIQAKTMNLADLESEIKAHSKCLIVSDGFDFEKFKTILPNIPKDVVVIGVNRSLAKWKHKDKLIQRKMDYFLTNNPFKESLGSIPKDHSYFPKCIVSSKTCPEFIKNYRGTLFVYCPVFNKVFCGDEKWAIQLDDYRNPICAAISLINKFNPSKVALACCDDSFADNRPGSEQLHNKLYMYPVHKTSHALIEGCLYWLKRKENRNTIIVNASKGLEYKEVEYIELENLVEFFN